MAKETISQTEGLCKEVANCVRNAYDRGYKQGGKDAENEARKKEYWEQGYNEGLKDAWKCCRDMEEILFNVDNDKFSEIFGAPDFHSALTHFDVEKCIQKIKEYEEKQKTDLEVKVGDEVIDGNACNHVKGIVTFVSPIVIYVLWYDGSSGIRKLEDIKKTGRYFGKITEVLEQLKGEI